MSIIHSLAEGFPSGLLFVVIAGLLWGLGAIFGNTKTKVPPRSSDGETTLADIRQRVIKEQQRARKAQVQAQAQRQPPPLAAGRGIQRTAQRPVATAPSPVQIAQAAFAKQQALTAKRREEMKTPAALSPSAVKPRTLETARNVRLLLQPGSIGEAFVLSEVLGKPVALRDGSL